MLLLVLIAHVVPSTPAIAVQVRGQVVVDTGAGMQPLEPFDEVPEGATVTTQEDASAQLRLESGSLVKLGPETTIAVKKLGQKTPRGRRKESLKLVVGKVWARVTSLFGDDSSFEMETDNAVAGVRGTSFFAEKTEQKARFVLTGGTVDVTQGGQTRRLEGRGAFVEVTESGFGELGMLDATQLRGLFQKVGGSLFALVSELKGVELPLGETGEPLRGRARKDIVGPDRLVDGLLRIQPEDGPPLAPTSVDLEVQLQVPDRSQQ